MEVEVKFPLKNPKYAITILNRIAKVGKINEFQKDTYYKLKSDFLRLRESKSGNFISFKKRISKISCDNYYTRIRDIKPMEKILSHFGFKKVNVIKKIRNTWFYKDIEIAVDDVKNLGCFIELEARKQKNFLPILKKIGAKIGNQDFKGYSRIKRK